MTWTCPDRFDEICSIIISQPRQQPCTFWVTIQEDIMNFHKPLWSGQTTLDGFRQSQTRIFFATAQYIVVLISFHHRLTHYGSVWRTGLIMSADTLEQQTQTGQLYSPFTIIMITVTITSVCCTPTDHNIQGYVT